MSGTTLTAAIDLPARAASVAAIADTHADEGDRAGQLSQPVVDALHRERILAMWVPKAVGGSELDVVSSLRVIENLSYGDPSTGWVAMAASLAIGTGAAYLKDEAVDELFILNEIGVAGCHVGQHPRGDAVSVGEIRHPGRDRVIEPGLALIDEPQQQDRHVADGDRAVTEAHLGSRRRAAPTRNSA